MDSNKSNDFVRQEYKRYKRKKPLPDFSDVIDFNAVGKFQDKLKKYVINPQDSFAEACCKVGLKNPITWEAHWVNSCPGFMVVKDPFLSNAHKYWTHKALTEYTKKPYPCNLDVHMKLDENKTVWEISKEESPLRPYTFMEKLRWAHLGYHFDYNSVNYKEEKYYGFPDDLSQLMKCIAKVLGFENYAPETAIVNYYPIGSSMGGHTDHYEEELDAPLLSVSFGQPAVFLIGGKTKDIKPQAIWVRSGDLVIMSGDSRVAYHAVPCIIKEGLEGVPPEPLQYATEMLSMDKHETNFRSRENGDLSLDNKATTFNSQCYCDLSLADDCGHLWTEFGMNKTDWEPFSDYLSKTRVNINVRQVHKR